MQLLCATHTLAPVGAVSAQIPTATHRHQIINIGSEFSFRIEFTFRFARAAPEAGPSDPEAGPVVPRFSFLDVIRKEAWPFYRTSSGVRLCWELEEPKGFKGFSIPWRQGRPLLPGRPGESRSCAAEAGPFSPEAGPSTFFWSPFPRLYTTCREHMTCLYVLQGYLAHTKTHPPRTLP